MDLYYPIELDGNDLKVADNRNLAVTEVLSPILTELGERRLQPLYGGKSSVFDPTDRERLANDTIHVYYE